MRDGDRPLSEDHARRRHEFSKYLSGALTALVLTLLAFAVPVFGLPLSPFIATLVLALLAVVQIAVHFRSFLHVDLKRSHRDDLLLVLFTTLIILLMVSGSIWILSDQHSRM